MVCQFLFHNDRLFFSYYGLTGAFSCTKIEELPIRRKNMYINKTQYISVNMEVSCMGTLYVINSGLSIFILPESAFKEKTG